MESGSTGSAIFSPAVGTDGAFAAKALSRREVSIWYRYDGVGRQAGRGLGTWVQVAGPAPVAPRAFQVGYVIAVGACLSVDS